MKRALAVTALLLAGCGGYLHQEANDATLGSLDALASDAGTARIDTAVGSAVDTGAEHLRAQLEAKETADAVAALVVPIHQQAVALAGDPQLKQAIAGLLATLSPAARAAVEEALEAVLAKLPALLDVALGPETSAHLDALLDDAIPHVLKPVEDLVASLRSAVDEERRRAETLAAVLAVGILLGAGLGTWHAVETRKHRRTLERRLVLLEERILDLQAKERATP